MKKMLFIILLIVIICHALNSCCLVKPKKNHMISYRHMLVYELAGFRGQIFVLHKFPERYFVIQNDLGYHALGKWRMSRDTLFIQTECEVKDYGSNNFWEEQIKFRNIEKTDSNIYDWPRVFLIREKKLIDITDYMPLFSPSLIEPSKFKGSIFDIKGEIYEMR